MDALIKKIGGSRKRSGTQGGETAVSIGGSGIGETTRL